MNYLAVLYLFGALYCLGLGCFVLGKNTSSNIARAFFLQTFFAFIWQIGTYFVLVAQDEKSAFFSARFTYLGAIFISCATYHLIVNFLKLALQKRFVWFGYILGVLIFLPLLRTDLLISGVYNYRWGFWFKAGIYHPLYLAFFLAIASAAFLTLALSLRQEAAVVDKKKRKLFLLAYLIAYLSLIDFLPDYGFDVLPLGFFFVIAFLTIICYILKYYDFIEDFDITKRLTTYQP